MITRNFNLFLNAGKHIPLVINVNQYDHDEQWCFTLLNDNGEKYIPSTGAIVGIKADRLGIINSGTVNASGQVVINETEQMTAAVGKAVFELLIDDQTHGTANFVVLVEEKPGNNADLSETDISMIEEAIEAASSIKPYGSPLVASTVAGMTDHEKVYVYVGSETGYTSGNWYYWDGTAWTSGGVYNSVAVQTDTTLTLSGVAADAKKTGDEISDLKRQITNLESIPFEVKTAMDKMFAHALYKDYDASSDYATFHAWANTIEVTSITAVFTQGENKIFTCDNLDTLKQYLVVTATYSDESTSTVEVYALSGNLTAGTSTITVSYQGVTTTFTVNVTEGTDVTPALSSLVNGGSTAHTVDGSSIRVYSTSARAVCCVYTPITPKYGYTYLISADITWVKGKARFGIENASTEQGILLAPITATTESGSYSREAVLSDSDRWTTNANFKLWCTWSTSEQGDVTFSNIRVIEYLAEE